MPGPPGPPRGSPFPRLAFPGGHVGVCRHLQRRQGTDGASEQNVFAGRRLLRPPRWAALGLAGPRAQRLAVSGTWGACPWEAPPTGRSFICGPHVGPGAGCGGTKQVEEHKPVSLQQHRPPPLQSLAHCLPCSFPAMPLPLSAAGSRGAAPLALHAGSLLPAITSLHMPVWECLGLHASSTPLGGGPHGSV